MKKEIRALATVKQILIIAFRINRGYFIIMVATSLFLALSPVLTSYIFGHVLNTLTLPGQGAAADMLLNLLVAYGGVLFVEAAAWEVSASLKFVLYRYDITKYFTEQVIKKAGEVDLEFYENSEYADLRAKALDSFEWRPTDLLTNTIDLIQSFLRAIFTGVVLIGIAPVMTVVLIVSMIPGMFVDAKFRSGLWDIWNADVETRRKYGHLEWIVTRAEFAKELRLLGIGGYMRTLLVNLMSVVYAREKRQQHKRMLGVIVTAMIPIAIGAYVIYRTGLNVIYGEIGIGTLSFFAMNIFSFKDASNSTLFTFNSLIDASRYVDTVFEFLRVPKKITTSPNAQKEIATPPAIEFRAVDFAYPGTNTLVLDDFSLSIKPGEKVALVGENGSGKTTIVKLILRLYDIASGKLLINGVEIKDLDLEVWWKQCAVLLQDFNTFHLPTLAENIGFGNWQKYNSMLESERRAEIESVGRMARMDAFVLKNEKGYDSILGKDFGGIDLSGGEYQRLALARTFFRDAGLIIMDEPTSAVDAKAEAEIFSTIKTYLKEKTVIFVSHRFSTVRIADRIVVIEEGKILEEGSHDDLMKQNGLYNMMFSLQAEGYK